MVGMDCSPFPQCWRAHSLLKPSSGWLRQGPPHCECHTGHPSIAADLSDPSIVLTLLQASYKDPVLLLVESHVLQLAVLRRVSQPGCSCRPFPSLLWLHSSLGLTAEALMAAVCSAGCLLSAAAACGIVHPVVFTLLWMLCLSFKSLGGDFLDFG